MKPERPETPPRNEKGREVHKPEMDPRREKPDRKEVDPDWGISDADQVQSEERNLAKGQSEFMKPERADRDSNQKSGAL